MNFENKINEELKNSMKESKQLRTETLRSIRAAIIEFNKSGIGREMNEDDGLKILMNQAKKRKDAIEMYEKAGRTELLEKEKAELEIINEFLPAKMSDEEVENICKKIIADLGITEEKDFGRVMGVAMKELKGKADGGLVQSTIKRILGS